MPRLRYTKLTEGTDRHSRRRPFTNLMKRLASLKNSSDSGTHGGTRSKKTVNMKNNPYPASGRVVGQQHGQGRPSFSTSPSGRSFDGASPSQSKGSIPTSTDGHQYAGRSTRSAAPTVSTNPETMHSETAQSKAGTVNTGGGTHSAHGIGGEGSTFSSPAPSVRSLTTTLTTIQSAAPNNLMTGNNYNNNTQATQNHQAVHFSHQFPTSPPASAIPSHVVGQTGSHPSTYTTATANNLLTDNASILTLASSSKRRRRNSLDTNASVRALAPSSIFGGSRESLPLSVLSGPLPDPSSSLAAVHSRPSVGGIPAAERASLYSSSGVAPALSSERNSYYANKQGLTGDGASVRSGKVGHSRNDSVPGSITGTVSPLASPRESGIPGKTSRRNSGWGEVDEANADDERAGMERKGDHDIHPNGSA